MKITKLLTTENPLIVLPSLAVEFGLTEAMLLQQIHYWMGKAETIHGGKVWTYQTFDDWHAQFPFISIATIRCALNRLQKMGVVLMTKLAKWKSNRTNYYTIDYQKLEAIAQVANDNGALVPIVLSEQKTIKKTQVTDSNHLLKSTNPSAEIQQIHLSKSDTSICSEVANVYTETHQREHQRKKERASNFSKQPEPIIPPATPTAIGTSIATTPAAEQQQLEELPSNQRELWKQLRLAKVDIAHDDPLIAYWISKNLVKNIIQRLFDAKAVQPKPSNWHTPTQLGLCLSSSASRRTAA